MNELVVDIGGSLRGFQQATDEAVGSAVSAAAQMEERQKKVNIQSTDNYVSFWQQAIDKREAADMAAHEKRQARMKEELESYTITQQEMLHGSGGYGWRNDDTAKLAGGAGGFAGVSAHGARMGGLIAGQAAMELEGGGTMKEVTHGAMMIAGGLGVEKFVTSLMEGKFEGLRRLPSEIMHVIKGFRTWGMWIAKGTLILSAIAGIYETIKAGVIYHGIGTAKAAAEKSGNAQNAELDQDGQRLRGIIDAREKSGALSRQEAEHLRSQLDTHTGILAVMKQMVALQSEAFVKDQQATAHRASLAELAKYQRQEMETEVSAENRLLMLMQDEGGIKKEIQAAESAHDEETFLAKSRELLKTQHEIFETKKDVKREYDQQHKPAKEGAAQHLSQHVDAASSAGLFQSLSAATNNPVLEVARQQLHHLETIAHNTGKHSFDPHAA